MVVSYGLMLWTQILYLRFILLLVAGYDIGLFFYSIIVINFNYESRRRGFKHSLK